MLLFTWRGNHHLPVEHLGPVFLPGQIRLAPVIWSATIGCRPGDLRGILGLSHRPSDFVVMGVKEPLYWVERTRIDAPAALAQGIQRASASGGCWRRDLRVIGRFEVTGHFLLFLNGQLICL